MGWGEPLPSRGALREAAKLAARARRDELSPGVSDYVVGEVVEAALAIYEGRPARPAPPPPVIDVAASEHR